MIPKQERLENSINVLNQNCPNWVDKIDLETFNITTNCVLDQVFGDFLDFYSRVSGHFTFASGSYPGWELLFSGSSNQKLWESAIKEIRQNN